MYMRTVDELEVYNSAPEVVCGGDGSAREIAQWLRG
jgi:hypothetical protein